MVAKDYDWRSGVPLRDHSARKHKILREYIFEYILVRCKLPQQSKFRLALVDGFSGGGRYSQGEEGSPLIFLGSLAKAFQAVNIYRASQRMGQVEIECALFFNDASQDAIELLKEHTAPLIAEIHETLPGLHVHVEFMNEKFELALPKIKERLTRIMHQLPDAAAVAR